MRTVTIVTGASRGIGLAVCKNLLSQGGHVMGVARTPVEKLPHIESLLSQYPDKFEYLSADITVASSCDSLVTRTMERFRQLDSVVFNAGVLEPIEKISEVDVEDVRKLFEVNLFSIITLSQKALPHLRKAEPGRIILVSSGAAVKAYPGWGAYCMSKCALNMLGGCLAVEEKDIITVSLRPGVVDTEMQTKIREPAHASSMTADAHANFVKLFDDKKLLSPDVPGSIISRLALNAPKDLNGIFLSWDDERLKNI
ncbi:hypothetical protein HDU67_000102 [Dinochytrium kinnereticum]|nr:hypothetical protein HDU67_000102 [Dinochytrium kinnereticum]